MINGGGSYVFRMINGANNSQHILVLMVFNVNRCFHFNFFGVTNLLEK